jgi:hypothetical protein
MDEVKKYVCWVEDLDKPLPQDLGDEFRALFSDNWRLNYKGSTPKEFLKQFEIDYDKPTVRDAVAFDLVKLDDDDYGSVSNDNVYTYGERKNYSPMEYERYLLNRNFRINLVNLDPDWSNITYEDDKTPSSQPSEDIEVASSDEGDSLEIAKRRRTVDKVFQGIRISKALLGYFDDVIANYYREEQYKREIYVPFTNANDFSAEVALVPNTHPDFRQITSRAYYDSEYAKYKRMLLNDYGITGISTFALVDPKKD